MQSKYPNVCVALVGLDQNAFAIVERSASFARGCSSDPRGQSVHGRGLLARLLPLAETVLRIVETTGASEHVRERAGPA
jgi:hypothetical protein